MSISITVELPDSVAEKLGGGKKDLSRIALEAMALELYRSERLSSFQTMAHGIELEYGFEDLERERAGLDLLLKK
jgi:hypothetical protein